MESLQLSFDPSLDDFFNLDALSAPVQPALSASGSQSSASPRSPFPFQSMPLTPPPFFSTASIQHASTSDDPFFSLFMDDDFSKAPSLPPAVLPYDFLTNPSSSGINLATSATSSISPDASSSRTSPTGYSHSPQPSFGIDPQLVGTPATSRALSDFDEEEYLSSTSHVPFEEEEDKEEDPPSTSAKSTTRTKVSRKGTVLSGGVKKTSAATDKENTAKDTKSKKDPGSLKILEPEDWRPSPEEYKKMSSKEKRQLRNKISARNFRVRRKEYITTLEGDIAERDRLIDAIRSELGSSRSENIALRQEISALKKCLLEGRGLPDLPPPAELLPSPASPPMPIPSTSNAVVSSSSSSIVTPNTQKDLPTSPRLGNRAFWGGLGGMGVTPVHTTFIPPIAVLASKVSSASSSPILQPSIFYEETIRPRILQENINPGLNPTAQRNLIEKKGSANINPNLSQLGNIGAFDTFTDTNPFTFKSLDAYRMQLWGKMAAQQYAHTQQTHTPPSSPPMAPSGLASGLRPHFFTGPTKVGGILSPKASAVGLGAGAYPSPPSSPPSSSLYNTPAGPTREQAVIAALASQTLLGKLGQAFWDAFSGSSSANSLTHLTPTSATMGKQWDTEKVRKVLEGRAVLKVVDVEPAQLGSSSATLPVSSAQKIKGSERSKSGGQCCTTALTDILEESMRSLTLGKKMN
ncbi:hypothetical protein SCLCIDRAFT_1207899 [Scleroderma citrinum Foug A]|uniref:BZIP domain-containing protein n=1 Tax=Scleroderma citrinum Foug A TaxID=1036808 RepID=A0A0C3EMN5_9AGAM|nr:hypothetical protein SCLCIDRAFT_1207899 [Scleroderma citrinum Foug A]